MTARPSIFDKIAHLNADDGFMGARLAERQPSVADCVNWLSRSGLTRSAHSLQRDPTRDPAGVFTLNTPRTLGMPTDRRRIGRLRDEDIETLRQRYRREREKLPSSSAENSRLWNEYKNPGDAVRDLDIARIPADALAFYRPFHVTPQEDWGIYLLAERLMEHSDYLYRSFQAKLVAFTRETLMGCILFEVFHHEFFHHVAECAATSFEIASAAFGTPRPIYTSYWDRRFEGHLGQHADHPLEEALANAYAYNSFSFLSRMQIGVKLVWVKLYQEILKRCWPQEPAGYRSAGKYINADHVSGGAQLLAMLLSSPETDAASLMLLAKTVLPNGNSAFMQKPDVPTYLVGEPSVIERFHALIPLPNETYTALFWLGDTTQADQYLRERKENEAAAKKQARKASQPQLFV